MKEKKNNKTVEVVSTQRLLEDIKENQKGITLVALVVTIVVLLILAGITIMYIMGDNGVLKRANKAVVETEKAQIKEELQLKIVDLQLDKVNGKLTKQEILKGLENLDSIDMSIIGDTIEGEYKDYAFIIEEDNSVEVEGKLQGDKPEGLVKVLTQMVGAEEIEIQVVGKLEGGEIVSIEALNDAELKTDKGSGEKIFVVKENGKYTFRIRGSNGRSTRVSCIVSNAIITRADLLDAIDKTDISGEQKIRVVGKTSLETADDEQKYGLNVIIHKGDMILDGITEYAGSTLANNQYTFGDSTKDIGKAGTHAQNTIVLKVEGNLTINEGITLTSVGSNYGGPKGMVVYCTGKLINNGIISMTGKGGYAPGQNVYLLKKQDETYEFIPANGAGGGGSQNRTGSSGNREANGIAGGTGSYRTSGGGGSGSLRMYISNGSCSATSGAGGRATSYSGGAGGGGIGHEGTYGEPKASAGAGGADALAGKAKSRNSYTGGPGAGCGNIAPGGTLIVYAKVLAGSGQMSSRGSSAPAQGYAAGGSSGGGQINLFYTQEYEKGYKFDIGGGTATTGVGVIKSTGGAGRCWKCSFWKNICRSFYSRLSQRMQYK